MRLRINIKKIQMMHAPENKVFGRPTFVVKNEIFWGDDRVEDSIIWSKK